MLFKKKYVNNILQKDIFNIDILFTSCTIRIKYSLIACVYINETRYLKIMHGVPGLSKRLSRSIETLGNFVEFQIWNEQNILRPNITCRSKNLFNWKLPGNITMANKGYQRYIMVKAPGAFPPTLDIDTKHICICNVYLVQSQVFNA